MEETQTINEKCRDFVDSHIAKETEDESLENLVSASVRNSALSHMRPSTIRKLERN